MASNRWIRFGEWLRQERLKIISPVTKLPISQREAAQRGGVSRASWTRWENGEGISYTYIPSIAQALGRTTEDEINEVYIRAGFAEGPTFELPPQMRHFEKLAPEIQNAIAQLVEAQYLMQLEQEKSKKKERGTK
jgi:transcriptional regulator with XRE-family HTH domain